MRHLRVGIYSFAHFLVDLACAFFMFRFIAATGSWLLCLLLYNACAFALQMPLGLLADQWDKNALFAAIGVLLVMLAPLCASLPGMLALVLGIGNAMFHVGGGLDVLNMSEGKSTRLGIFVSPGALGLYLGTLAGKQGALFGRLVMGVLAATAVALLLLAWLPVLQGGAGNAPLSLQMPATPGVQAALVLLFLVVCLRSYVGMTLSFPWKGEGSWGALLVCAVALGKAAGGILCDRLGAVQATLLSLGLAAVLFLFPAAPVAGVLAVFLFNMSMPITLFALARIFPGAKGFSFGMLTFALFLGFVPVYMGYDGLLQSGLGFAAAALISMLALFFGLRKVARGC